MSCIYDLVKTQETYHAEAEQSVLDVARGMVERNIGAVPVLRDGLLVGVFSERDLMRRVVAEGLDPAHAPVADVMTEDPSPSVPAKMIWRRAVYSCAATDSAT